MTPTSGTTVRVSAPETIFRSQDTVYLERYPGVLFLRPKGVVFTGFVLSVVVLSSVTENINWSLHCIVVQILWYNQLITCYSLMSSHIYDLPSLIPLGRISDRRCLNPHFKNCVKIVYLKLLYNLPIILFHPTSGPYVPTEL